MSADLALIVDDPSIVERSADPAEYVIAAMERAKAWLANVLEHGDIDTIVEIKSQAEAIRVYTMQKQLGKDAQLSAAEIVRRAERGIGVAIRRGQENGTIRRQGQGRGYTQQLPKPTDFATHDELMANDAGIYDVTDGVSDEDFEGALSEARQERNLSRANVVRKVRDRARPASEWIPDPEDRHGDAPVQRRKLIRRWAEQGYSSRQMEELLGTQGDTIRKIAREIGVEIAADELFVNVRHHDSSRIVQETTHILEGAVMGLELVSPDDLDPAQVGDWVASLTDSIRAINRFIKTMKETIQ